MPGKPSSRTIRRAIYIAVSSALLAIGFRNAHEVSRLYAQREAIRSIIATDRKYKAINVGEAYRRSWITGVVRSDADLAAFNRALDRAGIIDARREVEVKPTGPATLEELAKQIKEEEENGATPAPEPEAIARYLAIFGTPISFYGKVVDQEGKPVDGAKVKYETGDQPDPNRKATSWTIATDGKGEFSIVGKGAQLYVETSRDGYYRTPNIGGKRGSFDAFPYAMRSPADPPLPTKDSPAIFVLRKKGAPAALTHSMADTKTRLFAVLSG